MHAFILAGGFATRLWPLTEKRAKPLLPLAGVPIIEYLVRNIPKDIPITISTNAVFKDAFEAWALKIKKDNIKILIEQTQSDDQKLGALGATAQWIRNAKINDDVLLLTGDNYCGFSFDEFIHAASPDTTLIAVHDIGDLEKAKAFGTVLRGTDNTVVGFEEKPKDPKTTLVNTGCYLLNKSVLPIVVEHAQAHPDDIGGIFEELLQRNKPITCFAFSEAWFDIGSFDAYIAATKTLVGEKTITGEGSTVERSQCTGSVVIGQNTDVQDSVLSDTVIFEDCVIENCILHNCVLDKGCHLKGVDLTGKMLREGTYLQKK